MTALRTLRGALALAALARPVRLRDAARAARAEYSMTSPRMIGRAAVTLLAAALLPGASNVTGKSITDIRTIEGTWQGQIKLAGGPYEIYYLTINPDATIVASWGATTRWGKVTLGGGKARFSFPTSSGDLYYYEEAQGRVITRRPDFGGWDAQVRPLT